MEEGGGERFKNGRYDERETRREMLMIWKRCWERFAKLEESEMIEKSD